MSEQLSTNQIESSTTSWDSLSDKAIDNELPTFDKLIPPTPPQDFDQLSSNQFENPAKSQTPDLPDFMTNNSKE